LKKNQYDELLEGWKRHPDPWLIWRIGGTPLESL
jgi:hypothetical protein